LFYVESEECNHGSGRKSQAQNKAGTGGLLAEGIVDMQTREEILQKLKALKPLITERYRLRSIALFGSYARGDQTEESDVDVLVDVDPSIGLGFIDLADMIEERLGIKTDVVPADGVKARYRAYITKDLLYV
jgi:predicted nucleotidyltransferase